MNTIREIERLNKLELENVVPPSASWHTDYRSTAYIHISGLPYTLTEGDILTIFSQFGEPTCLHLARDKDSGKSKGFAWLKYEDQRSTDLAVDNLGAATVMQKILKVDHTHYKRKEGEDEEEARGRELRVDGDGEGSEEEEEEVRGNRELLKEEVELMRLEREHDDDDPMKEYLVREKKEEVRKVLEGAGKGGKRKHRHHHRRHRSREKYGSERKERDGRHRRSEDRDERRDRTDNGRHRPRRSRSP